MRDQKKQEIGIEIGKKIGREEGIRGTAIEENVIVSEGEVNG